MCGVAGMVAPRGASVSKEILYLMTQTLEARGPDGRGFYHGNNCGLGHRRLAIVDLNTGQQPYSAEDVHAVVNGEIYNFRELRRELEDLGCTFRSDCDSEVVAHGYRVWGDRLPSRLQGMFALAAWSEKEQRLFLARDRMGQKPLYFAFCHGWLLFASELKAILQAPVPTTSNERWDWEISPDAVATYLSYECLPQGTSMFKGIEKLCPGEQLQFDRYRGAVDRRLYWSPPLGKSSKAEVLSKYSKEELVDQLDAYLLKATERRLMADVPLGVLLSGGVDSSLVTAAITRLIPPSRVRTFSVSFGDSSYDESPYAAAVASHFGTKHMVKRFETRDVLNIVPEVMNYLDEPLGDASILPTYMLSSFVRESVKVVLGGDGGDELFLGYPTFIAERWAKRLPLPLAKVAAKSISGLASMLPVGRGYFSLDFKLKRLARGLGYDAKERHIRWLSSFSPEEITEVLRARPPSPEVRKNILLLAGSKRGDEQRDVFDGLIEQYLSLYLAGDVLLKVDRASMANGLEVRAPFLDQELVEFACALPSTYKLFRGSTKYILRELARRYIPQTLASRPKQGFAVPMANWLRGPLRDIGESLLATDRLLRQGIFDPQPIRSLWDAHQSGIEDHRKPLWTLLAFQLWYDRYGSMSASMRRSTAP